MPHVPHPHPTPFLLVKFETGKCTVKYITLPKNKTIYKTKIVCKKYEIKSKITHEFSPEHFSYHLYLKPKEMGMFPYVCRNLVESELVCFYCCYFLCIPNSFPPVYSLIQIDATVYCVQHRKNWRWEACGSQRLIWGDTDKVQCYVTSWVFNISLFHAQATFFIVRWINMLNTELSPKRCLRELRSQEVGKEADCTYHYTVTTRMTVLTN